MEMMEKDENDGKWVWRFCCEKKNFLGFVVEGWNRS
jgi:hypothetical protein